MIPGAPRLTEIEIGREAVQLLDKLLAVSVDRDMVIVRIYGADASHPDLHIGTSADRALRIGLLFAKAACRLDPRLVNVDQIVARLTSAAPVALPVKS